MLLLLIALRLLLLRVPHESRHLLLRSCCRHLHVLRHAISWIGLLLLNLGPVDLLARLSGSWKGDRGLRVTRVSWVAGVTRMLLRLLWGRIPRSVVHGWRRRGYRDRRLFNLRRGLAGDALLIIRHA